MCFAPPLFGLGGGLPPPPPLLALMHTVTGQQNFKHSHRSTTTRHNKYNKWSMDGPHTHISVYLRVIFLAPHRPCTCVMLCMVIGITQSRPQPQAVQHNFFPVVKYC